jgi:hypothetical protein
MLSDSESFSGAGSGFLGFFLSILGGCRSFERREKPGRNAGDFIDCREEDVFVRFRGLIETADFSHELERGCTNLFVGDGRIEVEQSLDISAHDNFKVSDG